MKSQVEPPFRHRHGGFSTAALLMGPYKLMDLTAKKGEVPRVVNDDEVDVVFFFFPKWWVSGITGVIWVVLFCYFGA